MARAVDLLRNYYSGSQIGGYFLPKLGSLTRSLFPSSDEAERDRIFEGVSSPQSVDVRRVQTPSERVMGSGTTDIGKVLSENYMTPKTATNIFSKGAVGASPMAGGSVNTRLEAGTPESSVFSDIFSAATGPLAPVVGGVLGMIFGGKQESPEEIARRKLDQYTGKLTALRDLETKTTSSTLSQDTASAMRQVAQIASRQAAALGKTEQTASFAMPATTNIAVAGGRNLKSAVMGIQSRYNQQIADAEAGMLGVPAEESFSDVLSNIGELTAARSAQEDFFTRLQQMSEARDRRLGYYG